MHSNKTNTAIISVFYGWFFSESTQLTSIRKKKRATKLPSSVGHEPAAESKAIDRISFCKGWAAFHVKSLCSTLSGKKVRSFSMRATCLCLCVTGCQKLASKKPIPINLPSHYLRLRGLVFSTQGGTMLLTTTVYILICERNRLLKRISVPLCSIFSESSVNP